MKTLHLLLSAIFLSTLHLWIMLSQAVPDSVLDLNGQMLQTGAQYYALPGAYRQGGGGLTLALRNGTCPMNVAQHDSDTSNGLPLTIAPADAGLTTVPVSTDVKIVFAAATICVQSTAWRIGDMDSSTGRRYVTTGRGASPVNGWFRIERDGEHYKLMSCPRDCADCKGGCGDVGIVTEGGKRWLALSDVPFPVVFKKV